MKIWKQKNNGIPYNLKDDRPIYNLVLKRLKIKRTYSPLSLSKIDLLNFMYYNRGIDKSLSKTSKISSIKFKSSSINKSKSNSTANRNKKLCLK
jgi:hypothetical protein